MSNSLRFISPTGEELSKKQSSDMFNTISLFPERVKIKSEPPKNMREFEDRWGWFEEALRNLLFGLIHDIESGKTLKKEITPEVMVDALCYYEKNFEKQWIINAQLQSYSLITLIIEKDAPLIICDDTFLLGIERDRSGLSLPQKK